MTDYIPSKEKAYLLVKNPAEVFVCWTWSRARIEAFENGSYGPEILLRLSSESDKAVMAEVSARWDRGRIYMKPPVEGATYTAAVYARKSDGAQEKLLESNAAVTAVSCGRPGMSSGYASAEFFRREPRL